MIHHRIISKLLGILLLLFGVALCVPILVELLYQDGSTQPYLIGMCVAFGFGDVYGYMVEKTPKHCCVRMALF